MTGDRSIEEIRAEKREQLQNQADTDDTTQSQGAPTDPIHIESPQDLNDVAQQYHIVLTDFYADWCGPCQMLEPVVARVAEETDAAVAKVDVDRQQQLAAQYGVRGVPTLVLFSGGEAVEQLVGMQQFPQLKSLIDNYSN